MHLAASWHLPAVARDSQLPVVLTACIGSNVEHLNYQLHGDVLSLCVIHGLAIHACTLNAMQQHTSDVPRSALSAACRRVTRSAASRFGLCWWVNKQSSATVGHVLRPESRMAPDKEVNAGGGSGKQCPS